VSEGHQGEDSSAFIGQKLLQVRHGALLIFAYNKYVCTDVSVRPNTYLKIFLLNCDVGSGLGSSGRCVPPLCHAAHARPRGQGRS
jgi:hypothetical protein